MRINLTGFTSAQRNGYNTKNVIGFSNLLKTILEDNGHIADYGLENPDLNIVCVLTLGSLNIANVINCLELLRNENCIIAFDDWNIKEFYKSIDGVLDGSKLYKTHPHIQGRVGEYLDVIENLAQGKYKVLYPAYKTGNHDLLEIRGDKYCLDPSVYIEKDMENVTEFGHTNSLLPVHASLATKWSDLNKKKYTILNVRNETEDKVFEYYCRHRIVMTPPHYHDGSGWFRNRYTLANKASAVIIEDNSEVFGDSYKIERKEINERNINQLFEIQNKAYQNTIMSKEEISKVLKEVL